MTADSPPPCEKMVACLAELNRLRRLADAVPECLWVLDLAAGKMSYVSAAYETIWGRRVQDLLDDRLDWLRHVHPDDRVRMKAARDKARGGGLDEEFRVLRPDGQVRWLHLTTFPIRDTGGRIESIGGVAGDITGFIEQRDGLRTSLTEQQRQAETQTRILDALPANIAILDADGRIVEVNESWRAFARDNGVDDREIGDNYLAVCDAAQRNDGPEGREAGVIAEGIRAILSGGDTPVSRVYPCHSPTQERWFRINAVPLHIGETHGAVVMHIDVTERMQAEQRLLHVAHYDALTTLPNRLLFRDRLNSALALSRHNDWVLAVCVIDIDRFKSINDSLGHQVGDRLLKDIAVRLQGSLRDCDTVSRLGGDEFALILPELKDQQGAALAAQRIIQALAEPFSVAGNDTIVTASIGISLFPADAEDIDLLIRNADTAMYRAKEAGRNSYQFFTGEMNAQVLNTLHMERDLRQALEHDEFRLHYQPKVSCRDGGIVGFEALLRWQHPQRGLVSPMEFVPLLEETGLIVPVGDWVLKTACTQARAWHDAGLGTPSVAVNVSGRQIHGNDICASVQAALSASGLDPKYLEVELTESHLMHDADGIIATLRRIKEMGVAISVDDFGTGYSSLAYLKRFPLDMLKIDRAFVQDITADPNDVSITRAIINLAHSFNLEVVAEGVETESQLRLLIANQCDVIQGYFFSRPLPPDDIARMLAEKRALPDALLQGQKPRQRTLLLVDDEKNILQALKRVLRSDGYTILTAGSAAEGFDVLAGNPVDVIVSDHLMPNMTGIEFMRRVKTMYPETVRLLLSGYADLQMVTNAINEGAVYKFLQKPWEEDFLRNSIKEAFRNHDLARDNLHLQHEIKEANNALERLNTQLWHLVAEKEQQMQRSETSLAVAQEILQHLPWPVIGIDDENTIAFANPAADVLCGGQATLIARNAAEALPAALCAMLPASGTPPVPAPAAVIVDGKTYRPHCERMGQGSRSKGTLLILLPAGTPA